MRHLQAQVHCATEAHRLLHHRRAFAWAHRTDHRSLAHAQGRHNYGLYFTWWDRIGGTEHPAYRTRLARPLDQPLTNTPATKAASSAIQPMQGGWWRGACDCFLSLAGDNDRRSHRLCEGRTTDYSTMGEPS